MTVVNDQSDNEALEIRLLVEAIYLKYGYDFRNYALASLRRRILHRLNLSGMDSISRMLHEVLYNQEFFETLFFDLSVNVTEMFRDPSFYLALRKIVIPELRHQPFIKIWIAGCATGEEAYSIAILMKEEGIYDKSMIYATDFNPKVIEEAKIGIYPVELLKAYTANYQKSGGVFPFSTYYSSRYNFALMDNSLKEKITFADHNLVTDGVFGEMNLILCRNVLIYFNRDLQDHVLNLFHESLADDGFLCLGNKETTRFSGCVDKFSEVVEDERIYQKIIPYVTRME